MSDTKKFYTHYAESHYGEGVVFFEFWDQTVYRQVEIYNDRLIWMTQTDSNDEGSFMADQPLDFFAFSKEDEITEEKFLEVWNLAKGSQ